VLEGTFGVLVLADSQRLCVTVCVVAVLGQEGYGHLSRDLIFRRTRALMNFSCIGPT